MICIFLKILLIVFLMTLLLTFAGCNMYNYNFTLKTVERSENAKKIFSHFFNDHEKKAMVFEDDLIKITFLWYMIAL